MDIIGKIYKDYFCDIKSLDGKSHLLDKYYYGGIFNLLNKWDILEKIFSNINFKFYLITDSALGQFDDLNIKPNILYTNEKCPKALIFDFNGQRTSFVIDDEAIEIPSFNNSNNGVLIFYGDKLIPKTLPIYKKIFIDTAGNNYSDLISLAKYNYPNKSIISISDELLTDELIDLYTVEKEFIILSHCPKLTKIITKESSNIILNKYYISLNKNNFKATGLGDKFVFLIACNFLYHNFDLYQSVKESQKILYKIFLNK